MSIAAIEKKLDSLGFDYGIEYLKSLFENDRNTYIDWALNNTYDTSELRSEVEQGNFMSKWIPWTDLPKPKMYTIHG